MFLYGHSYITLYMSIRWSRAQVLLHYLKNVPVLHAVSVFLTIRNISIPNVAPRDRLLVREVPGSTGIFQVGSIDIIVS